MIGVAAGLASENFNVITTTFAPFQTIRCCEQIKINLGYMKHKVTLVGLASGLALGNLGFTHCCIEDIGILRTIPNITILSPADSLETVKALQSAVNLKNPSYLRLTGASNNPIIYTKDYEFKIKSHYEVGENLDMLDFDLATKTSGSRFVFVKNKLAKLERALSNFMIDVHTKENGYEEISPPLLANFDTMFGTGQLPKFESDQFEIKIDDNNRKFLIPTAEVILSNIGKD